MKKFILKALLRIFSWLPLGVHYFNAHIIGWLARVVVRYRRKVVKDNIDNAFPEKSEKERRRIFRGFYLHFGQIVAETVWFGGASLRRLRRSHISSIQNPDEFKRLRQEARGTIVLYAHCGNWEILGGFPYCNYKTDDWALTEKNTGVVYKKVKDPVWDEIFGENRLHPLSKDYNLYVESSFILRHILEHKDENIFWFLGTDQWPYGNARGYTHVTFMHRKTRSMVAGAEIARRIGFAVAYLSIRRGPGHKKYLFELKTIADDASTMDTQAIVEQYYKYVEQDICADPGNYLWSHRRWHDTPDTK